MRGPFSWKAPGRRAMDANLVAGLSAFAGAAAACLRVSLRRGRSAALWGTLAALHAAWALEIVLNLRYRFRTAILPLLQERGWYEIAHRLADLRRSWSHCSSAPRSRRGSRRRHRDDGAALAAIAGTRAGAECSWSSRRSRCTASTR